MFSVKSLDGNQNQPINAFYVSDFEIQQGIDGTSTLSFMSIEDENNPGHALLENEATVFVDGHAFKIKQLSTYTKVKKVSAINIYFELTKKYVYGELNGTSTLRQRAEFIFDGTGYTLDIDTDIANEFRLIEKFGKDNVVSLNSAMCTAYGVEFEILPGNIIHITKEIGPDLDFQYRYKHNIEEVVLNQDTSNLYTRIKGFGADGLEVEYTSPNASVFGILEASPVSDERYTIEANLLEYVKSQLQDEPQFAIESKVPAMTNRAIGEKIWLVHEPLGILTKIRIISQTKGMIGGNIITTSVVFGNYKPKTSIDTIVEQQKQTDTLNKTAVKQGNLYNGVEITPEQGVVVTRSDGAVTVFLNATEGIKIVNNSIQRFYVDTQGNVVFDGALRVTSSGVTVLEAFRDSLGGVIYLNDDTGLLNVKIGSENGIGTNRGGTMVLYDDGTNNPRVELGINSVDGAGAMNLKDGSNRQRLGFLADSNNGPNILMRDENGNLRTFLSNEEGRIAGQIIATQFWVSQNYATPEFVAANYPTFQWVRDYVDSVVNP